MKHNFTPLDYYRNRFYEKERDFKGFLILSEEQLSILSKKVYKKQETRPEKMSQLERYKRTIQYLTSSNVYLELRTFDERIAYLIMAMDPNLVTFKEFLKLDLISLAEIAKIEDESERAYLYNIRKQTISEYQSTVREKIGFYDTKLLKYERMFFKKFFNEKELFAEAENDNEDNLILKAKSLKDFNSISDERYNQLCSIAQTWLSSTPKQFHPTITNYSVKLLGLTNSAEQLAIFILLIDSDLDMLKIHEEESMMKNTEKRIIEQFGYFNKDLLVLERKFHTRFCPNKQLSIWS